MKKIVTIGGSTSSASINKKWAEYLASLLNGVEVVSINLNEFEAPIYSLDNEMENGFPESIQKLNSIIEAADGFIISLAEHNGAYSAAFKNTFDWLTRMEAKVWRNKPMLLTSTSPGERGGKTVLDIATSRFPYHNAQIIASFPFPSFQNNFKESQIVSPDLQQLVQEKIAAFQKSI